MHFIEYRGDIIVVNDRNMPIRDAWLVAKNKQHVENITAILKIKDAHEKYKCTYDPSIMAVLHQLHGISCLRIR